MSLLYCDMPVQSFTMYLLCWCYIVCLPHVACSVTVCQSTGAMAMRLSGDYLLKLLDNSLVLHTPSGVGVCQWMMEDVHLFTMSTDNSLLLHASHK